MRKDLEKLFFHLNPAEPSAGLFEKIMRRIWEEQRISAIKQRVAVFSVIMLASMAAFIPAFKLFQTDLLESGFLQFLSLILSDFGTMITYWHSFTMSLLETIPATSLAVLFIVVFAFLGSFKLWIKDIKFIFMPKQLINI